jgi:nitrogen fixation-related uncharacterized protein
MSRAASFFTYLGLSNTNRSILALVLTWILHALWLGLNYFWRLVSVEVLLAVPVLLLLFAVIALVAYLYWGIQKTKYEDAPYANIIVGFTIAVTLLYFNYSLLQLVLQFYIKSN